MPIYVEPCYSKIRRKFLPEQQSRYPVKRSHKMIAFPEIYRTLWLNIISKRERERRGELG
jgi:hypothetical protein